MQIKCSIVGHKYRRFDYIHVYKYEFTNIHQVQAEVEKCKQFIQKKDCKLMYKSMNN